MDLYFTSPSALTAAALRQPSTGSPPDTRHTSTGTTSGGGWNHTSPSFFVATLMNRAHIGTASWPANPFLTIVRGLSNPTHTPATIFGVKPTNHASTKSLVVPVLPAAGNVNPTVRARFAVPASTTSASIVAMRNAVDSDTARRGRESFWKT